MPTNHLGRRTREYLRLILTQIPGTVWATDRELRITYALGHRMLRNDATLHPLVGTSIRDFVRTHDPAEPVVAHHLAALIGEHQPFEYLHDGRWFDVLIEPLHDESGATIGCVGAAIDVTERRDTQARLARSEARLAEAQRLAHVGSFEWDVRADIVTWSEELRRIYAGPPGESAGTLDAFLSRVHEDDVAGVRAALLSASRHRKPFVYEHRIVRPPGEVRVLHAAGDVVGDGAGAQRVVGSCWDITTQHETMQKLQHSVSLLEATLEATEDGILVVGRNGRITAHNARFPELWRIPPSLVARGDDSAILSYVSDQVEGPREFLDGVRDLYASPDRKALDVIHFKDGRVFERYSTPQRVGGDVVGRVWSFRDVTERETLLQRASFLADAARLLSSLDLSTALDGVARLAVPYLGDSCVIALVSNGHPDPMVTAKAGDAKLAPEVHPPVLAGFPLIYTWRSRSAMAVPLRCRNGVVGALTIVASATRRYVKTDIDLLDELGRRVALCIDNARLYDGARDALKGRDEFLSIAAHEIRGPLTSIHLAVQGLMRGSLSSSAAQKALELIEREDRRLSGFVDDLLDLGRIRTGQLHFELAEVDLGTVVRDAVSRLVGTMTPSASPVTITTTGNLVGQWDRARLDQVVTNLVSNAIKYGGGKPVHITAAEWDGHAMMKIADSGIGIEPAMRTKIFDPFQRAAGVRRYGGLGLGLHIAKTIVEGLGGTISVDSRPGAGSTFTVNLPVSRSAEHAKATDSRGG